MKWATHQRLSREAIKRLGIRLTEEELSILMEGAIAPDKWKDYPHHYGKSNEIEYYLTLARTSFLSDNLPCAYYNLGVALHYIQDAYTTYPSFLPKHEEWECWIENSNMPSDTNIFEVIQKTIKNPGQWDRCLSLAQILSNDVHGRRDTIWIATQNCEMKTVETIASPQVDLYLGFKASCIVSNSILGPKNSPDIDAELSWNYLRYRDEMRISEDNASEQLLQLLEDMNKLAENKISSTGILGRISKWVTYWKVKRKCETLRKNLDGYIRGMHLEIIKGKYLINSSSIVDKGNGWYNVIIPRLDTYDCPRKILEIESAAKLLGVSKQEVINSLTKIKSPLYYFESHVLVRRDGLDQLLSISPINGLNICQTPIDESWGSPNRGLITPEMGSKTLGV